MSACSSAAVQGRRWLGAPEVLGLAEGEALEGPVDRRAKGTDREFGVVAWRA